MNLDDPRVRRTRKLLQDGFMDLITEKGFHALSVQDIADRATVNRATFYAHFEDKYALLDHMIREQFREALLRRNLTGSTCDQQRLVELIETVLEFVARFHGQCRPSDRDLEPTIETTIQRELRAFLMSWLAELSVPNTPLSTVAGTLSWALFGAGIDWSQEPDGDTAQKRARQVLAFVTRGLVQFSEHETEPAPNLMLLGPTTRI